MSFLTREDLLTEIGPTTTAIILRDDSLYSLIVYGKDHSPLAWPSPPTILGKPVTFSRDMLPDNFELVDAHGERRHVFVRHIGPAPSAPHGSVSAYKRHLRHKETPCEPCRTAWNEAHRTWYRKRKPSIVTLAGDAWHNAPRPESTRRLRTLKREATNEASSMVGTDRVKQRVLRRRLPTLR